MSNFKFTKATINRAKEWPKGLDTSFWYMDQIEENLPGENDFIPKTEKEIQHCKEKG